LYICILHIINYTHTLNRRTKQLYTFYVPLQRSKYGQNAAINRLMQLVNYLNVDMFSCVSLNDFNYYLNNLLTV
jgi:hypothetical protein